MLDLDHWRKAVKSSPITIAALAQAVGSPESTVRKYLRSGAPSPKADVLFKISDAAGVETFGADHALISLVDGKNLPLQLATDPDGNLFHEARYDASGKEGATLQTSDAWPLMSHKMIEICDVVRRDWMLYPADTGGRPYSARIFARDNVYPAWAYHLTHDYDPEKFDDLPLQGGQTYWFDRGKDGRSFNVGEYGHPSPGDPVDPDKIFYEVYPTLNPDDTLKSREERVRQMAPGSAERKLWESVDLTRNPEEEF